MKLTSVFFRGAFPEVEREKNKSRIDICKNLKVEPSYAAFDFRLSLDEKSAHFLHFLSFFWKESHSALATFFYSYLGDFHFLEAFFAWPCTQLTVSWKKTGETKCW